MFIKQKTKDYFLSLIHDGKWIGPTDNGKPVFIINDNQVDVYDIAKSFGVKLHSVSNTKTPLSNKYIKVDKDADLGKTPDTGHPEESGDGISESEE